MVGERVMVGQRMANLWDMKEVMVGDLAVSTVEGWRSRSRVVAHWRSGEKMK